MQKDLCNDFKESRKTYHKTLQKVFQFLSERSSTTELGIKLSSAMKKLTDMMEPNLHVSNLLVLGTVLTFLKNKTGNNLAHWTHWRA